MSERPATQPLEPEHLTDLGNARRLVAGHGHELRYVPAWRCWLTWTGTHWQRDETGEVMRRAKATVATLYVDAGYELDVAQRKDLSQHALRSESEKALRAMVELAKTEPDVAVALEALDRDRFALNVGNGTLDLRTATLRSYNPADLITRWIPTAYDPRAVAPTWLAFLERVFGGRQHLIHFLQKAAGYALTGDTREQVIFMLHGAGANGKSTLVLAFMDVLREYAAQMSVESLLSKRQDTTVMNDLLGLIGARFVAVVEPDIGRRLAEGLVKAWTGGEAVPAKKLYADTFKFRPTGKIFLSTNHKPAIRGTDHAVWRRIRLVPFDVVIPDEEQDRLLPEKLRAEAAGILAWAVQGCLAWQREGLGMPEEVRSATARYRADMDALGDFLRERCVLAPGASVLAGELYAAFRDWCGQSGEQPVSQKALALELAERGLSTHRTKRARFWLGIRLATTVERVTDEGSAADDDAVFDNSLHARAGGESTENGSSTRHSSPEPDWVRGDLS